MSGVMDVEKQDNVAIPGSVTGIGFELMDHVEALAALLGYELILPEDFRLSISCVTNRDYLDRCIAVGDPASVPRPSAASLKEKVIEKCFARVSYWATVPTMNDHTEWHEAINRFFASEECRQARRLGWEAGRRAAEAHPERKGDGSSPDEWPEMHEVAEAAGHVFNEEDDWRTHMGSWAPEEVAWIGAFANSFKSGALTYFDELSA